MAGSHPVVEAPAPGVLLVRYEWPDQLAPEYQLELVDRARSVCNRDPVGLVFILADRICELPPTVRGFWRRMVREPQLRISSMAVVTRSWAVEVEALGFRVTNVLSGRPLPVETFLEERAAVAWALRSLGAPSTGGVSAVSSRDVSETERLLFQLRREQRHGKRA